MTFYGPEDVTRLGRELLRAQLESQVIPITESGCWIWMGYLNSASYGKLRYLGKQLLAHRASYMAYKGPLRVGLFVCHRCDIRPCINPDHLYLGTPKDNADDMTVRNRRVDNSGVANGKSRLAEADVEFIRTSNLPAKYLAGYYGINLSHLYRIKTGERWRVSPLVADAALREVI